MSHPLYVAFIWHQHQPLYKSRVAGTYRLPWVRLHGVKDYLDLVLLLERYPTLHQTVNLVPSLMLQLEDYGTGAAVDPYLEVSLLEAANLSRDQRQFVLEHFFDANHRTMIDVHPRYSELYIQRQDRGISWCLEHWQPNDFGDLMAWHNLSWIDPLFWQDEQIAGWLAKGKGFSRDDRQQIWAKQRQLIHQILPQHRKMQDSGQLEITTTPYTHPILPLLANTDAGRVAVPQMTLPQSQFQWPEDIPRHLEKARQMYCDRFGRAPRGLWPSEQSVSPAMLPYVAASGFRWLCSDEAVLGWTLKQYFHRDGAGTLHQPELLYRPYRLETSAGDLAIVFRDHRLSDLIGFTYSSMAPEKASLDLISQLEAVSARLIEHQENGTTALQQPWLVTIALDGENCWEFYAQDGKPFLEALYSNLSLHPNIRLVTVSEFLDQFPASETLPTDQLHSGSWVDGSFTTWIGDPAKNRAWDLLTAARQTLARHPESTETTNPAAWEALYAAEGSDWFWWFGDGHSSNHDAIFDQLFREHLISLYQALGEPVPDNLFFPVEVHEARGDHRPEGFIHPIIDGRGDEQDWNRAGRFEIGGSRGTMHRSSPIQRLWYGLDHLNFYLRLDFQADIQPRVNCPSELHLLWYYTDQPMNNSPIPLGNLPASSPLDYLYHHHLSINLRSGSLHFQEAVEHHQWHARPTRAQVGLEQCLEIAVPWADLPTDPDWNLRLLLVLAENGCFQGYLPEDSLIPLTAP